MTQSFLHQNCRADFPVLTQRFHDKPLAYLDTAATSQKPQIVIDAVRKYYEQDNANIHRGIYQLSERATKMYELVREEIRCHLNAKKAAEIIYVKGTTEAINLVASGFEQWVSADDEILISQMEHHSNIVPWQILCEKTGAILKIIPISIEGEIDLDAYAKLLSHRTRLVSITHVSNVLGTINPVKQMIEMAHAVNAAVLVDGAQAVPHMQVDVQNLDCDFYAFSSDKAYGPTGIGVLYGKAAWLDKLPVYQTGGDMIRQVTFEQTTYAELPAKFEAGTPNIAGVIGMGVALAYLRQQGYEKIAKQDHALLSYATERLAAYDHIRLIGTAANKIAVVSFVMNHVHAHDVGTILDTEGVAVRVGHHCTMPLMDWYQVPATVRASFGVYSNQQDVDQLCEALNKVQKLFGLL